MSIPIGQLTIEMAANVARLRADMERARKVVESTTSQMAKYASMATKALGAIGLAVGAMAAIKGFAGFIQGAIDSADEASKLAQKAGIATSEVAGLQLAFRQGGVDAEGLQKAVAKLSVGILDGNAALKAMGISAKTLSTHVIVAAWKWGAYMGQEALDHGIRVKTSSFSRHHVNVTMCKAKANGNYMNSILAHQEAAQDGYEEALLLDVDGFVAEGSGENIFIVRNGKLYTPDLTAALEGITRDTIVQLAGELGIPVIEKRITRDEVYGADEAFFTGTAAEVTPIRELDRRSIGAGTAGPITKQLQKMYFDIVHGRSEKHADWLTLV